MNVNTALLYFFKDLFIINRLIFVTNLFSVMYSLFMISFFFSCDFLYVCQPIVDLFFLRAVAMSTRSTVQRQESCERKKSFFLFTELFKGYVFYIRILFFSIYYFLAFWIKIILNSFLNTLLYIAY